MKISNKIVTAATLILIASISRLIPHAPNFTPLAAMAFFAGAKIENKKYAIAIPFIAMLISDAILGFHSSMFFVYFAFAVIVYLGSMTEKIENKLAVPMGVLLSSISFFVITNFGSWITSAFYTKDFNGLLTAYTAAIPFYRNELAANILYSATLFGLYYFSIKYLESKAIKVKN